MKQYLIAIILLFCTSNFSFGQSSYLRLIEKGKFAKAEKQINKAILKEPNDIGHNYTMAILLINRKHKGYNVSRSYEYLITSNNLYTNIYDEKEIKKLNKIPINTLVFQNYTDTICKYALEEAIAVNTIEGYEKYLDFYKTTPYNYKNTAIINRDIAAFKIATATNSVESYQYFISKYPNAIQINVATSKRNECAFNIAKTADNINDYKSFINKYPSATEVNQAWLRISELAFAQAEKENTAKAYKKFMDEYPTCKQYAAAFKLFEEKQFFENTTSGNWGSYKSFIENFQDNSWINIAIDSIYSICKVTENLEALKYCINNFSGDQRNEALILFHDIYTNDGEISTLDLFYGKYDDDILESIKTTDYELAELGNQLSLHLPYNLGNYSEYDKYIRLAAPRERAFVALQRMISTEVKQKKWQSAINKINGYKIFFAKRDKKLIKLIEILEKKWDNSILISSIGENINTISGKEYVPIISADNKSLYFCGKVRRDNIGGEDIFVSRNNSSIWGRTEIISELSDVDKNDAPLSISSDGNELFLFYDGDIFSSRKKISGWDLPTPISEKINSTLWEGDASLSSDGNSLLFVRSEQKFESNYEIVFLIDATGSMQPCINGVKNNIIDFISTISGDGTKLVNWKAKIIDYRDAFIDLNCYSSSPFVSDVEELTILLSEITADGGGDEPESTIESIYRTLQETKWSKDESVTKVVVCFTDATDKKRISNLSKQKYGEINAQKVGKVLENGKINLYLFCQEDHIYSNLSFYKNTNITQYPNAVNMLQTADYSLIMASLSESISLLSNNAALYHGDKNLNGDILISHKDNNGQWTEPKKIGAQINTSYSERTPFLHPDMKTLYFSSDGHGGIGKLDLFMSTRLADSCWDCWSEAINLGKEINTEESDWGYKISTDGNKAYFSKKKSAKENEDIYWINLPPHLRPDFVATVSGKLLGKNNSPVAAEIRWEDLQTGKSVGQSKSDPSDGSFFIVLPLGRIYGYYVDKDEYFPMSNNLDLRTNNKYIEIESDISMVTFKQMIEEGTAVPINNLFFDFGKYNLLPYSIPELKRVASIIKINNLKVEIDGYTDNIGDDRSNQVLSEQRANSVKEFLISEGCDASLLTIIGFGKTKPVASNENENGRAKNRRVELKFVK